MRLQNNFLKNIDLYDHETIVNENNRRLIGFGRYGMGNTIRGSVQVWIIQLAKAETLSGREADQSFEKTGFASVKICDYRIRKSGWRYQGNFGCYEDQEVSENYLTKTMQAVYTDW
jgi:hypothetical protein